MADRIHLKDHYLNAAGCPLFQLCREKIDARHVLPSTLF